MIEFGYGWLKDALGNKFAPKTTSTLVINPDNGDTVYKELNEMNANIDSQISNVNTSIEDIISGETVVAESEHATSADSSELAAIATKAEKDMDGNVITSTYETKSNVANAMTNIQTQIDEHVDNTNVHMTTQEKNKLSNIDTTIDSKISTHNTSTEAHNDIRVLISDLATEVSNFLDVDDTTRDQLSEVLTLIDNNKGTLESLTTSKVNVSDIIDNLTTASANKVLSANQGVVLKTLIDELESLVGTKADSSALSNYYTKEQIDGYEFITPSDIDNICGSGIQLASEVMF